MKVQKKITGTVFVEGSGDTHTEIWEQLAKLQEVFGQDKCGKCGSEATQFVVREVADGKKMYKYYELHCQKCRARLSFGQHNEGGTLFPKRKDDSEGTVTGTADAYLPDGGWLKWDKEKNKHY